MGEVIVPRERLKPQPKKRENKEKFEIYQTLKEREILTSNGRSTGNKFMLLELKLKSLQKGHRKPAIRLVKNIQLQI